MKPERRPPFSDVPRRWLNIAAVVGGVIGLLLSQLFGWSDVQTFIVTIGVAGLCVLLTILLLIARFYQNVSGERTYYWVFSLPIVIFGAASARYAFVDGLSGDALGDLLWFAGGVLLAAMCIYLYNVMTAGR